MKADTLPRGVHALADVLTMILTDLPPGCLPDGEDNNFTARGGTDGGCSRPLPLVVIESNAESCHLRGKETQPDK